MSALLTALVASETKETLATSLLAHRQALRRVVAFMRRQPAMRHLDHFEQEALNTAEQVLDTLLFTEAGNRDRVTVTVTGLPSQKSSRNGEDPTQGSVVAE